MTREAWLTLLVIALTLAAMAHGRVPPSLAILSGTVVLMVVKVVEPDRALAGFANPAPITIAALLVVARAVERTGATQRMVDGVLRAGGGSAASLIHLLFPVATASAFLNNTSIVAMLVPAVSDWSERTRTSPSRYLMPLSFAAILGGIVTAIGTSTNLIVSGMLEAQGHLPLGMFEIAGVGLPLALVGVPMVAIAAPYLLPERVVMSGATPVRIQARPLPASRGQNVFIGAVAVLVVGGAASGVLPLLDLALLGALGVVLAGTLSLHDARHAIDLDVVVAIAAAFGLAAATQESGLAGRVGYVITDVFGSWGPRGVLCGVVVATIVLTTVVTNNATAVLMFPIAVATARELQLNERAFAIAVAVAASGSFLTPVAYQTNLLVHKPGGYRFSDYLRLGFPVTVLLVIITVLVVPVLWPLR